MPGSAGRLGVSCPSGVAAGAPAPPGAPAAGAGWPVVLIAAGGLGLALAIGYLLAPPLGTDLSAQVARADFAREHGLAAVDLRWYGGTLPYGYSLVSPYLMAVLGVPLTGALALVSSSVAVAALLYRGGTRHPLVGGVIGAACLAGNLVSGRVTYALGVMFGLLALLALTARRRWVRVGGSAAAALLAAATSPVAGLFVGLAAVALLLARALPGGGSRAAGRPGSNSGAVGRSSLGADGWGALGMAVAAAVPLVLTGWLAGSGGWMNISRADTLHAVLTGAAVAALVRWRAVRIGALLSSVGVLAAFVVHTPVGLNATRLATMFALPVLAAGATLRWRWLAPALVALALWQPPVLLADVRDAGNPTASARYFAPLIDELRRRGPVGRVEVPPTRDYWESAHLAAAVPLARGWLRQVDLAENRLFFDGSLSGDSYRDWLWHSGVGYVALPDARLSWVGRREGELVRAGQPYLTEVWRDRHWTLYRVGAPGRPVPSIVEGAELVSAGADRVVVDVTRPADVLIRVRWSGWLRARGPAGAQLVTGPAPWTTLRAGQPGRYEVTSFGAG